MKWPEIRKGRPIKTISEQDRLEIHKYKSTFNSGYQRVAESVSKHLNKKVTAHSVQCVFEMDGLYTNEKEFVPTKTHKLRFVARYVNQIWHTDLKYWDKREKNGILVDTFLIAFIDDRSRKILHLERLKKRTMKKTAKALRNALEENPKPHMVVIDNGREFIGEDFSLELQSNGILEHRIKVGQPEENGKIERFLGTLQRTLVDRSKLQDFVVEYNTIWNHNSLRQMTGEKITPEEAWRRWERYEDKTDLEIDYYEYEI